MFKSNYNKNICLIALEEAAKKSRVMLLEREVQPEHVHIVVELPLTIAPTKAIGMMKSISAKIIFALIPKLRLRYPRGHLWSAGKFVINVGNITLEKAKEYVKNQAVHHAKKDYLDPFTGILARATARVSPQAEGSAPRRRSNFIIF